MKKNILVAALMLFAMTISAQTVEELTPLQRLEKAKREAAEAKQAIKEAKLAAKQEEKALKLREKEAQNAAKLEAKVAKMEAEAQRLKAQAAEERARLEAQQQAVKAAPAEPKTVVKEQVQPQTAEPVAQTAEPVVQTPKKEAVVEQQGWTAPKPIEPQMDKRATSTSPATTPMKNYLAGAVPEIDGKVIFTLNLDVPGKSAEEIYNVAYSFLNNLTIDDNQRKDENSTVALVNKQEGKIVARLNEWLEFSRTSFSLDRAKFNYVAIATCSEGKLQLDIERLSYGYEEKRPGGFRLPAEELISDKAALNKKGELIKSTQKFRIYTIDRIQEIFNKLTLTFNQ